jgi:chorismate dehydratase
MTSSGTVKRLGWIPYLNLVPLYTELRRLLGGSIDFVSGHPSTVNQWLADGVVDLAPASSIAMLSNHKLKMAVPIGIASEGCVQSVYLGLHVEHRDFYEFIQFRQRTLSPAFQDIAGCLDVKNSVKTMRRFARESVSDSEVPNLRLTPASAASAALTEALLYLWCGDERAQETIMLAHHADAPIETDQGRLGRSMELVIGDEALKRHHEFWQVLDLGHIWHQLTGLPFVFGLWQTTVGALPNELLEIVVRAAMMSEVKMRTTPEIYVPHNPPLAGDGTHVDLCSYWGVIQYGLTRRHMQSLSIYYQLVADISKKDPSDLVTRMNVHRTRETQPFMA